MRESTPPIQPSPEMRNLGAGAEHARFDTCTVISRAPHHPDAALPRSGDNDRRTDALSRRKAGVDPAALADDERATESGEGGSIPPPRSRQRTIRTSRIGRPAGGDLEAHDDLPGSLVARNPLFQGNRAHADVGEPGVPATPSRWRSRVQIPSSARSESRLAPRNETSEGVEGQRPPG